jgi:hypothetical protein
MEDVEFEDSAFDGMAHPKCECGSNPHCDKHVGISWAEYTELTDNFRNSCFVQRPECPIDPDYYEVERTDKYVVVRPRSDA